MTARSVAACTWQAAPVHSVVHTQTPSLAPLHLPRASPPHGRWSSALCGCGCEEGVGSSGVCARCNCSKAGVGHCRMAQCSPPHPSSQWHRRPPHRPWPEHAAAALTPKGSAHSTLSLQSRPLHPKAHAQDNGGGGAVFDVVEAEAEAAVVVVPLALEVGAAAVVVAAAAAARWHRPCGNEQLRGQRPSLKPAQSGPKKPGKQRQRQRPLPSIPPPPRALPAAVAPVALAVAAAPPAAAAASSAAPTAPCMPSTGSQTPLPPQLLPGHRGRSHSAPEYSSLQRQWKRSSSD
jgi:hypothetical protein